MALELIALVDLVSAVFLAAGLHMNVEIMVREKFSTIDLIDSGLAHRRHFSARFCSWTEEQIQEIVLSYRTLPKFSSGGFIFLINHSWPK